MGECSCTPGFEGNECQNLYRDKWIGRYSITYRGTLTQGNQFDNPTVYNIDTTAFLNIVGDVASDRVVIPNFLSKPGQNLICTAYQTTLSPATGTYTLRVNDSTEFTFNFISLSQLTYREGQTSSLVFNTVNLSANTEIDVEMILSRLN
jgi:hypothetical protein